MVLMMVRLFVMARLLSVQSFGQVNFGLLVSGTFAMLGCLGLQSLLQRELPVRLYRGQQRRGLISTAQCNVVALGCLMTGMLTLLPALAVAGAGWPVFMAGLIHGYSQQTFWIATVESRSRGETIRFAFQNVYRSSLVLLVGSLVALESGSAIKVLTSETLITLVVTAYVSIGVHRRAKEKVTSIYRIAARTVGQLRWGSALTLMGVTVVGFISLSLDRWVAANLLNFSEFAQYAFAWILLTAAQSVQAVVNASAYPLLARRYAATGWKSAYRICVLLSGAIIVLCLVLSIPAWLVFQFGVHRWFPQYINALQLVPLFLIVSVLRVSDFWTSYLLVVGRESRVLALNIGSGLAGIALWLLIARPWSHHQVSALSVAYLATAMTIFSYCAVMTYAWRVRRQS